jgi:hypothetical protein
MRWTFRGGRGPGDGDAELDARLSEAWEAAAVAVGKMLDLPAGKEALLASSGLLQEGIADLGVPAGMTRQVAQRCRRRLALRSVAGVAAALTAAAVALAVVVVPGSRHDGSGGPVVATAYVARRVDSALSAAGPGQIAQMTVSTRGAAIPGGATTAEEWAYGDQWRSVTYSPAGHPVYDEGSSSASVNTLVSYQKRIWARQPRLAGRPAPISGPRSCKPVIGPVPSLFQSGLPGIDFSASLQLAAVARSLRSAISCGTLAVAGRQRVDGIEAIELTSRPGSLISETIWVSPSTYLPVRVVVRSASGTQLLWQTADITWLRPTAQNLARLTVTIPAGFRQAPFADAVGPVLLQIPGHPKSRTLCPSPASPVCDDGTSASSPGSQSSP